MDNTKSNRRPLASRGTWWSRSILSLLLKTPVTPNQISVASILFAAFGALGFLAYGHSSKAVYLLVAIFGMQGRLLCNLMDGMLAVEGRRISVAGEIYNEIPDRVSDILILLGVGYGLSGYILFAVDCVIWGWLCALLAVLTAYIRLLGVSVGTEPLFLGPMAKPHRMALLTGACLIEMPLIGLDSEIRVLPFALLLIAMGCMITIHRRLARIYSEVE